MTATLFHSIWTILVLITFIGIVLWAYSSKRKNAFDEASRLPLEDDVCAESQKKELESPNG